MRVLVISHMYPSAFSDIAGVFVHKQVKELQKQGCEVRVISPVALTPFPVKYLSRKWMGYSRVPITATWDGIQVCYPRYLSFPRALLLASSGKRVYEGIRKSVERLYRHFPFDIIHCHVALPDGFAGTILKRQYDRPLVVTVHGADIYVSIHRNAGCRNAVAEVFRKADRIVAVSPELRRLIEAGLGVRERVVVIGNGVNPADVAMGSACAVSSTAGRRKILSVSCLIQRKGLEFNLRAFSELAGRHPDLEYEVIGSGPEEGSLKQLAGSLNVQDRVKFLGATSHEEAMRHMATADIFSLPSWNESFGVVYVEAMAHGKPVIACQGEGIAGVIEDGKSGLLVKPRDVSSLVQAMEFLLANPHRASEIGARARSLVLKDYTWEKNAQRHIEIYGELLKHSG